VLSGDADFVGGGNVSKTTGTDATVTVNGSAAMVDGVNVNWSGNGYSVSFTLADNTTGTRTINVADGGATFQLGTDANSRATLGIASLNSHVIGEAGTGYVLEKGFDMPPLMLTPDEIEAAVLGAQWVAGRADPVLAKAAQDLIAKIVETIPERLQPLALEPASRTPPMPSRLSGRP